MGLISRVSSRTYRMSMKNDTNTSVSVETPLETNKSVPSTSPDDTSDLNFSWFDSLINLNQVELPKLLHIPNNSYYGPFLQDEVDQRIRTQISQRKTPRTPEKDKNSKTLVEKVTNLTVDDFFDQAKLYDAKSSYVAQIYSDNCHTVLKNHARNSRKMKNSQKISKNSREMETGSTQESSSQDKISMAPGTRVTDLKLPMNPLLLTPTKEKVSNTDSHAMITMSPTPFKTPENPRINFK